MKREINTTAAGWALGVILALAIGFVVYQETRGPEPVDLTKVTQEDLEDREPPKRGQPGYRERITDPPTQ